MARALTRSRYTRYALYVLAGATLFWLLRAQGRPKAGQAAPSFDLPVVAFEAETEARVSFAGTRSKPLLIEVFASWCGTCRRSAPALAEAHAKYGGQLDFLGVSVDDDPRAAARAKQQWGIPYAVAHDERGAFARAYQIRVLPTFVVLNREGRIAHVSSGAPSTSRLAEWAEGVTQ
jgi:thiol-disulfide isomerase/thioredoxin